MGPRLRLPGSIRFRLTAWYALLLALVLAVLGVLVLQMTQDRLQADGETRLKKTTEDIKTAVEGTNRTILSAALQWEGSGSNRKPYSLLRTTDFGFDLKARLGTTARSGWNFQVVDAEDQVLARSEYAPENEPLVSQSMVGPVNQTVLLSVDQSDGMHRLARAPVLVPYNGQRFIVGSVIVGHRQDDLYGAATVSALRRTLLTTSIAGLVFAILGGWLLAGRALKPVARVTATAAQIAAGDGTAASLATRLRVADSGDEIARLSATFNAMLDRLETSFRAQQRFVADASHELRTPLTAIRGNVEVLGRQLASHESDAADREDLQAAVADVQRESARMGRLIDDLLFLVRSDAPGDQAPTRPRPVRLDEVARDAVRTAGALATGQRLTVAAAAPVVVPGDPDRLQQLLLILLDNALRHTPAEKAVAVEVVPPSALGGAARLVVRDEGEGISREHLPHLFDRFYRADGARGRATGGTGLGLAIAAAIVRGHGGRIAVASAPGTGSVFTVTLPAPAARLGTGTPPPRSAPTPLPSPAKASTG